MRSKQPTVMPLVIMAGLAYLAFGKGCDLPVDPPSTVEKVPYIYESSKIGLPDPAISAALRYLTENGIEAREVDKDNTDGLDDESDDIKDAVNAVTETPAAVQLPAGTVMPDPTPEELRAIVDG